MQLKRASQPATLLRWEQDGLGGVHGTATYFEGAANEVTVTLESFAQAHALELAITAAMKQAHKGARRQLLDEIGRIQP